MLIPFTGAYRNQEEKPIFILCFEKTKPSQKIGFKLNLFVEKTKLKRNAIIFSLRGISSWIYRVWSIVLFFIDCLFVYTTQINIDIFSWILYVKQMWVFGIGTIKLAFEINIIVIVVRKFKLNVYQENDKILIWCCW